MQPDRHRGQVALVTGASSGIGRALARSLAARRHDLVLVARRRDRLEELAAEVEEAHGIRADVIPCDLAAPESRDSLRDRVAALGLVVDTLALSAGFGMGGDFHGDSGRRAARADGANDSKPSSR